MTARVDGRIAGCTKILISTVSFSILKCIIRRSNFLLLSKLNIKELNSKTKHLPSMKLDTSRFAKNVWITDRTLDNRGK